MPAIMVGTEIMAAYAVIFALLNGRRELAKVLGGGAQPGSDSERPL